MAQIIINIPDNQVTRVRDAFAVKYGWSIDLGVTKTQFAKDQIIRYVKATVNDSEADTQAQQLRQTIRTDVEGIVIN